MTANPADRPNVIPWPPILLVLVVTSAVFLQWLVPLTWPGLDDLAARIVGVSIGGAGLALIAWAALELRRHATTVLPHAGTKTLVTTGPFAFRRNPIYIGDVLILFGAAELTKNLWFVLLALAFVPLVTWLAILPEERHLEAKFGDSWRAYRDRVRRFL